MSAIVLLSGSGFTQPDTFLTVRFKIGYFVFWKIFGASKMMISTDKLAKTLRIAILCLAVSFSLMKVWGNRIIGF